MLASGRYDAILLLATATAGNTLGGMTNWLIGRSIERFRARRWFPVNTRDLKRSQAWFARWGKWSLLLSWAPIVGDALPLVAGVMGLRFWPVLALVALAKGLRYAVIAILVGAWL